MRPQVATMPIVNVMVNRRYLRYTSQVQSGLCGS
jgi:hypothetical protein